MLSLKAKPGEEILGVGGGLVNVKSLSRDGKLLVFKHVPATYAPTLGMNLFAEATVDDIKGTKTIRTKGYMEIFQDDKLVACFKRVGRRFILNNGCIFEGERVGVPRTVKEHCVSECADKSSEVQSVGASVASGVDVKVPYALVNQVVGKVDGDLVHARFPRRGLHLQKFSKVVKDGHLLAPEDGSDVIVGRGCGTCLEAVFPKPPAKRIRHQDKIIYKPGEKAHADCNIKGQKGLQGQVGYLIIVDDASKLVSAEVLFTLKAVKRHIAVYREKQLTQKDVRLKVFKTDCGTEFINAVALEGLYNKGIITEQSPPYFKNANGFAEVHIQHIEHIMGCMMRHSRMTPGWWVHALPHAVAILNVLPLAQRKVLSRFMVYFGFKP